MGTQIDNSILTSGYGRDYDLGESWGGGDSLLDQLGASVARAIGLNDGEPKEQKVETVDMARVETQLKEAGARVPGMFFSAVA